MYHWKSIGYLHIGHAKSMNMNFEVTRLQYANIINYLSYICTEYVCTVGI